jgi:hypothetical protein
MLETACIRLRLGATWLAIYLLAACGVPSDALAQPAPAATANEADPRSTDPGETGQDSDASGPPASRSTWHGRIELKRENTSRGTPDESTKTTLRIERFFTGPVALLRVDFPFPDGETDFNGSPFDPHLGDIKVRSGFRPLKSGRYSFPSFIEVTFPTANPESLGSGKYQVSAAVRMLAPVELPVADASSHDARFEVQVQQVNSVAGDSSRKDIDNTKFELTFYDVLRRKYTMKLKLKPSVDWEQDGKTGAVAEIEGGLFFARTWRTWLMLGHRAWGPSGIPATYENRVEIGIARTY